MYKCDEKEGDTPPIEQPQPTEQPVPNEKTD